MNSKKDYVSWSDFELSFEICDSLDKTIYLS